MDEGHHRAGGGRSGAVGEHYMRSLQGADDYGSGGHGQQQQPAAVAAAKALAAATAAFSMLLLSWLALTGTVLALIVATPLLVLFSPVLVPAAITVALLTAGFVLSGGAGAAAVAVLAWMYRYLQSPAEDWTQTGNGKAAKDWAQHRLEQARAH